MIRWTRFQSAAAMAAEVTEQPWEELITHLADAGPYPEKKACPWIKLAQFGGVRTLKNSLRHDANVIGITGVEGDYDGEKVSVDDAVRMLEAHQLRAVVYTSPSHQPHRPRWRVLAPLSKQYPPAARQAILARLNGALGGILTGESFTLSQAFYYGRVKGMQYVVKATYDDPAEGEFIDLLDDLDDLAITKTGKRHANDTPDDNQVKPSYGLEMFEEAVVRVGRKLRTGDGRREMLKSYIASRSSRGLVRDELLAMVQGIQAQYFDPADPVDAKNIQEICDHFAQRDAGRIEQPIDTSRLVIELGKETKASHKPASSRRIDYPAPFPGVMADLVACANASAYKPQPRLNMLASIVGMAACINGEYSTRSGGRFNLYGVGSLQSGGGKDNPRILAETLAGMGGATIHGRPASGAGLEDSLQARRNQLVSIDEVAHILQAVNDPRAPAHIVDIAATLLKLYSASRSVYNKRLLAKAPGKAKDESACVPHPCVSVLGFATPEGLADAFNDKNFTDGLMARMIFVAGDPDVPARRPGAGFVIPDAVDITVPQFAQIDALAFAAGPMPVGQIVVQESPKIGSILDRLVTEMDSVRDKSLAVAPSLYARSYEKMERIACVLAIWEAPQAPVLREEHIEWARQMVLASDAAMLDFVAGKMHSNETAKLAGKLREIIRKALDGELKFQRDIERAAVQEAGCVSRSQVLRVSKADKTSVDKALAYMQDLGELVAFDGTKALPVLRNIDLQEA